MTAPATIVTPPNQFLQSPGPSRHDSTLHGVIRVPNGKGFPQLGIAEAMCRTGAGSEHEVIRAGIRALAALQPRPVEPQEREGDAIAE